eukprot:TRINITY_DN69393_c0_g1_i1.p1 TRINITY_DN69393_c0_g1~~TRINITY_DN69393_c0_g1_i1.p1  ORF type:complete len:148 (+),score=14.77 TRINITY_DN69393_c0_g1_i1:35-445(+)
MAKPGGSLRPTGFTSAGSNALTPRGLERSIDSVPPLARESGFGPPGHHQEIGLSHVRRAPKWSFTERRSPRDNLLPGPGQYNVSHPEKKGRAFDRPPRFGFGSAGRNLLGPGSALSQANQVPGPGTYGGCYTAFGY